MIALLMIACTDYTLVEEGDQFLFPKIETHVILDEPEGINLMVLGDCSGSMVDNFPTIRGYTAGIEEALLSLGEEIDWNLGVATSDPAHTNSTLLLTQDSEDIAQTIAEKVISLRSDYPDCADEMPFSASQLAYDANPGVFEYDGPDHFIIIADEDDQSSISPLQWREWADTNQNPYGVTMSTIGAIPGNSMPCQADPAHRLQSASENIVSICGEHNPYWGEVILPVQGVLEQLEEERDLLFYLEGKPIPSTIKVQVNNYPTLSYSYLPDDNSIQVHMEPGLVDFVTISYYLEE